VPDVLQIGDELPDLPLLATDGSPMRLSAYRGEAMVLVFLRHLG
jgi:peroxiredoxin